MGRKGRGPRLSAGTVFMLLLTLLVVLGCVWFVLRITGGGRTVRAAELIASFPFAEETPEPQRQMAAAVTPELRLAPTPDAASPAPAASPTPVPEKTTITIAAAGTVYAPKAIRQTAEEGGAFDFTPVFAGAADVLSPADLAIVTLETTTAGSEKGYGNSNTPAQLLDALRACGVDMVSLATEHALDMDYEGLLITMQEVVSRGLSYAGVSREDDDAACIMRIGGVQVAVLAYSYGLSDEGKVNTGDDRLGMLARLELERIQSDIARVRSEGANVVIVLPHWGTKNKQETPEVIRAMARELAKAGADVILGTHPNVPQGIERITQTRSDGLAYETVVCYSLGSLLTDARTRENTAGMAAALDITYDPVTRCVTLGELRVTPLYIAKTKAEDRTAYRVISTEDEAALAQLDDAERIAAQEAAAIIYEAAGEAAQL